VLLEGYLQLWERNTALEEKGKGLRDCVAAQDVELRARWDTMLALTAQVTGLEAETKKWKAKEEGRRGENLAWARRYEEDVEALKAKARKQLATFLALHRRFEVAEAEGAKKDAELGRRFHLSVLHCSFPLSVYLSRTHIHRAWC